MLEELNLYKLTKGENHTKYNGQKSSKKQWDKNRVECENRGEKNVLPKRRYQSTIIRQETVRNWKFHRKRILLKYTAK